MYTIPTYITIDGVEHKIRNNGDFRVVLDCFQALEDIELDARERLLACLIIFYEDINSIADIEKIENLQVAVTEMYNFFNCGSQSIGTQTKHKLIDWEQDSQLICSAVNKVAGTEIRAIPYLHWWTFMGYYSAIGESPLSTIIRIRDKIIRGKHLDKAEREFKAENPRYFTWNSKTVEEAEADKLVKSLWNSGE